MIIDRRSIAHMAADIKLVHFRLEAWGRWSHDRLPGQLPEVNTIGRLMEEGPGAGQSSAGPGDMPEAIAETDAAVAHLTGDDRRVLMEYYRAWAPREYLARRLKLSLRAFDAVLSRARWRVCGYLASTV